MISNRRLARIKKEIDKNKGNLIVITFKDGSELKVVSDAILDSFVSEEETEFTNAIRGKEIVNCSSLGKLISIIQQLAAHKCKELQVPIFD